MMTADRFANLLKPAPCGPYIEVRNHLFQYDVIPMNRDTREIIIPGNLTVASVNGRADHQHVYDKPWEKVIVFRQPQECPRCS